MPLQDDLDNWKKIYILIAPASMKEVKYDPSKSKQYYLSLGFKEVLIGTAPERIYNIDYFTHAKRKQYGLKHYYALTIHSAMGDTLPKMAAEISYSDPKYKLWDKGQLIVILSRTRSAKDTIFVGSKLDTLKCFKYLLTKKTQWTNHIEQILDIVTINSSESIFQSRTFIQNSFPFRIKDIELPQTRTG